LLKLRQRRRLLLPLALLPRDSLLRAAPGNDSPLMLVLCAIAAAECTRLWNGRSTASGRLAARGATGCSAHEHGCCCLKQLVIATRQRHELLTVRGSHWGCAITKGAELGAKHPSRLWQL
jgi:hypothetical protein